VDFVTAQSIGSIDRRVWDFDLNEVRSGADAPRTVLEPGTGKRKITGKKSVRGKQVRGKRSPLESRRSRNTYRPKQYQQTTKALEFSARDQPRKSTPVSIPKIVKEQRSVLGTVVSTDGLIVSKNSLVDRNGRCIFSDGQQWPYRVIATDKQRDLCLIEVKRKPTVPVRFDDLPGANAPTVPGTISVSIGRNRSVAAWGVVTLPRYDFQIDQTDGFELGMLLSAFPVSSFGPVKGVEVLRVTPRTLAEQMGLRVGDQILRLNGQKIQTRDQIETIFRNLRLGDLVTATTVDRMGRTNHISHRASAKGKPSMHDRWGGGPYSKRRFGFGLTLVHDSVLNPENCGGPLVGLQGELLGVNIARSMRVASLAIGSDDVLKFVKSHQPNAKLRLASLEDAKLRLARTSTPSK